MSDGRAADMRGVVERWRELDDLRRSNEQLRAAASDALLFLSPSIDVIGQNRESVVAKLRDALAQAGQGVSA